MGSVRGPCHALETLLHIEQLKECYMLALTERMTGNVFKMSSEFAEGLDLLRWMSEASCKLGAQFRSKVQIQEIARDVVLAAERFAQHAEGRAFMSCLTSHDLLSHNFAFLSEASTAEISSSGLRTGKPT